MGLIEVNNLSKKFLIKEQAGLIRSIFLPKKKEFWALNDVSFSVDQGEAVAYIGVNGSGKSTTIKLLTGILVPTTGEVSIMGRDPHKHRKRICQKIGVVFGQRSQLWWDLPVEDSFLIISSFFGMDKSTYNKRIKELDQLFDIRSLFDKPVRQLSLGQKMRCEIAVSILHNPQILFLDEPTIGLDIFVREKFKDLILSLNQDSGVTVMLTSHNLDEIEKICKRMILIDGGKVIHDGSIATFKSTHSTTKNVEFELENEVSRMEIESALQKHTAIQLCHVEDKKLQLSFETNAISSTQIIEIVNRIVPIKEMSVENISLEQILKERNREVI